MKETLYALTAPQILALCQDAIGLAVEYRDLHGYGNDWDGAVAKALAEIRESLQAALEAEDATTMGVARVIRDGDKTGETGGWS